MTTIRQPVVGAAVAREVRASPVSTVLGPAAFIGIGAWLMASTPAWWIGLVAVLLGVGTLFFGLAGVVVVAAGYRGPTWWQQATGRDVDDRRSPSA